MVRRVAVTGATRALRCRPWLAGTRYVSMRGLIGRHVYPPRMPPLLSPRAHAASPNLIAVRATFPGRGRTSYSYPFVRGPEHR
eukprot:4731731-Prymnesium_polylepis.1